MIDENKVMKLLENLNTRTLKSYGPPDLIHPRILKECRSNLVVPLIMIFKLSYETPNFKNSSALTCGKFKGNFNGMIPE